MAQENGGRAFDDTECLPSGAECCANCFHHGCNGTLHTPVIYTEKSWGEFRIIDAETERLTIKITFSPGWSLTYHLHERRDETWTVIEGRGWVKLDGNEFAVAEGQTVRIPRGSFHTIRAETLLKVMEIQTGEDIDVDDKIVWVKT